MRHTKGMIKPWAIDNKFNLYDLLRYITICTIAFFFVAQPTIEVVFNLVETEYELCESLEDDDVEEKEELKEEQKKESEFLTPKHATYLAINNIAVHLRVATNLLCQSHYIREFFLEILLPPPEQIG